MTALALLAATFSVTLTVAAVELVLEDGQVLHGDDVRREGDAYLLSVGDGGVVPVPIPLVREVRLRAASPAQDDRPVAPSGLRSAEPTGLAGPEIDPPRTSAQLAVFSPPARFSNGVVDPRWHPTSDWNDDPIQNNNFAPSHWFKDVVDSTWEPQSAFDAKKDVLSRSRSTFRPSLMSNDWQPQDGFKK